MQGSKTQKITKLLLFRQHAWHSHLFWETTRHFTEHLSLLQYALAWSFVRLHGVDAAKDTFANGVRMYTSHRRKYVRHLISESKYRVAIQILKNTHSHILPFKCHTNSNLSYASAKQFQSCEISKRNLVYRNWETMSTATRPFYLFFLFCCFLRLSYSSSFWTLRAVAPLLSHHTARVPAGAATS